MASIEEKIKKILEGKLKSYTFTAKEFDELIAATGDDKRLAETAKKLGLSSVDEAMAMLPEILAGAANGENYFARLERRMKRGELAEDLQAGFNTINSLAQLGISSGQIKRSNNALGALSRPGLPTTPREDEALSNAIYGAQQGTFDAARAVAPVRQGIEDAYTSDLQTARQASGGQSGTFGALAQTANLRKMRGYGEMAPLIDSIRAREQARLDNLLAMRQEGRQQDFRNRMSIYDRSNQNYTDDVAAASELGLAGRENMQTALGNFGQAASVLGSKYGSQPMPEMNIRNMFSRKIRNTTGVPEVDEYENQVNNDISTFLNIMGPGQYAPQRNTFKPARARQSAQWNPGIRTIPNAGERFMNEAAPEYYDPYRRAQNNLRNIRY